MTPLSIPRDQTETHENTVLRQPRESVRASGASAQDVLTTVGETIYEWDLLSDRIRWGGNAADVLGIADMRALSTGGAFGSLLHPDSVTDRHQAVLNGVGVDYGGGVPFDVTYAIRLQTDVGMRTVWLHDCGVWFADSEGAPYLARGVVRLCRNAVARGSGAPPVRELPRRGSFLRMVNNILAMAAHYRTSHAVVALSVDNLPLVARSYGVPAIEEMEAAIADRIRSVVRGGDLVGWLSESELGLVLAVGHDREATQALERIVKALAEQPITTSAGPVSALVSAGAVIAPFQASTLLECLSRARIAQAEARARGPGHHAFFSSESEEEVSAVSEVEIAVILGRALADGGVTLAYRPVVQANGGGEGFLTGRPEFRAGASGVVGWGEAAPVARTIGLGYPVDLAVLALAVAFLQQHPSATLQVPVFAGSLRGETFVIDLTAKLAQAGVDPQRLILDLAEPELQGDLRGLKTALAALRDKGCSLSIAEFGAGYASARILTTVQAGRVQIDRGSLRTDETIDGEADFARLITLAREFGAAVVAPLGIDPAEAAAMGADLVVIVEDMAGGGRRTAKRSSGVKPRIRGRKVA